MNYIVFGKFSGNVLGQMRSIGECGLTPYLIWVGEELPAVIKRCKWLKSFKCVENAQLGVEFLLTGFETDPNRKMVITTDNDEIVKVLNDNYDRLVNHYYFFNAGGNGLLSEKMEKQSQCEIALKCGLNVPKSIEVEVGSVPTDLNYPVITKASNSFDGANWKNVVHICRSESELLDSFKSLRVGHVILQEFIEKKNEYVVQGISLNNGDSLFVPIDGSYYRIPEGAYGSFLYFEEFTDKYHIFENLRDFFREIGYNGVFEAEFLVDQTDQLHFLEVNFRHTLWNHTFTNMGVNLCELWYKSLSDAAGVIKTSFHFEGRHSLMREDVDFNRSVIEGGYDLRRWITDFRNTDSFVYLDKKDHRNSNQYYRKMLMKYAKSFFMARVLHKK